MAHNRGARLLREWRVSRQLTQMQAAVTMGTTPQRVCLLEGGKLTPALMNAFAYEDATDGEVPARSWTEADDQAEGELTEGAA